MTSMLKLGAYYALKPFLPRPLRISLRRWRAQRQRLRFANTWPINQASGQPPEGWPGWPKAKQFVLVLTHDVESRQGLDRCGRLLDLERELGFRSSFNFVPEGEYSTPKELRDLLAANGFEVGIHDLRHDGKLYLTRSIFRSNAARINRYLKEWNAVGFRSGFMYHRLKWLHQLNVLYDASTFDTDPFEPQPDGADTIFPFWVPRSDGGGYVELPYTLSQDFTLFVLLREKTTEIWRRKVEWIAQKGGMVLLNTHPDYMSFNQENSSRSGEFPARWYAEFLGFLKSRYEGRYWNALPREVAEFSFEHRKILRLRPTSMNSPSYRAASASGKKIWVDLDNTPHIPFFRPIIRELEKRGHEVVLTARDAYQVCEMATKYGLNHITIGRHYGKNKLRKLIGFLFRTLQLVPFVLRERPALALSHGSRSQIFLSNLLRIPTVMIIDYEHAKSVPLARPVWTIVPRVLSADNLRNERIRTYSGIKEDVYAPEFKPDPSVFEGFPQSGHEIIVTVRPPATEAHYHNPESEKFFIHFMNRISAMSGVKAVLLPRNKRQEVYVRQNWPDWFKDSKAIIPETVVDGLNLLWHSDLAVSGGGTMNREAAALGVPVYSIFRGKIGAVDRKLQAEGRLVLIESLDDVDHKIILQRRRKDTPPDSHPRKALHEIIGHIEQIIELHCPD